MQKRILITALGLALAGTALAAEQFIPVPSYRVGPYASGGTKYYGGMIDYLNYVNLKEGGVGGVKLAYEECETEYKNDRGVECYERLKKKGESGASAFNFMSTGITYATMDRADKDKIPLMTIGFGRADAKDGSVFPYVFPLVTSYWSQATAKIQFIGQRLGGMDKLKGKKIVNLYHGSAYGKETLPVLEAMAKKYGFELVNVEVPAPGTEQQSQWLEVRRQQPDFVILRSWGVMTPAAIKAAAKVGFPRDKIVANWWGGSEEDVIPAGEAAKGYIAGSYAADGKSFPLIQDLEKTLYAQGKGNLSDKGAIGTVNYNRGVIGGVMLVEAIRVAQDKYGKKPLTGEQIRWGFEHLNIDAARQKTLGISNMLPQLKTSCSNHEGSGYTRFMQWDGKDWKPVSGWIAADNSVLDPLVKTSAARYAQEKGITPRDCSKEK
ncbi:ABC transporter substrate-binding protein [Laribacter hongkongensis]|uniref:ABC transporter substrate-binding protein n=1 Tax=Laribacter hongkongensis TaxID=168471 RepID=UPI001EFD05D9|nr:ABC transporter substrate-binding protein [Laribacter hongkongensis]MCG8996253.1 ABC transporter substrate-binding protein [Laribacter hongkongensis]MCG9010083.1 ABC transporter substrate-binding protein [Laribacter hongkongensis]MCG9022401.1 ABC transporter substrate-binding protein [Laribacter hongkongensis]MCG9047363.1 ABC transporter substrate-binding protein [Laribacter hongkongensis]MCG9074973.1 ABC transporter substrate-binding protein [Laribacter hongkongensis]